MTRIITLPQAASTNTAAAQMATELLHGDVVLTHCQTAGRGQRGNTWEAEPGMNLTFSQVFFPDGFAANRQFELSMAVSLGIADALQALMPGTEIAVKWPNDIYSTRHKVCGILIENAVSGCGITRTIAGVGINVNQLSFGAYDTNPASMAGLTGRTYSLDTVLQAVTAAMLSRVDAVLQGTVTQADLTAEYNARLWRLATRWATPDGAEFNSAITAVTPDGMLHLGPRSFAFKEVRALL